MWKIIFLCCFDWGCSNLPVGILFPVTALKWTDVGLLGGQLGSYSILEVNPRQVILAINIYIYNIVGFHHLYVLQYILCICYYSFKMKVCACTQHFTCFWRRCKLMVFCVRALSFSEMACRDISYSRSISCNFSLTFTRFSSFGPSSWRRVCNWVVNALRILQK